MISRPRYVVSHPREGGFGTRVVRDRSCVQRSPTRAALTESRVILNDDFALSIVDRAVLSPPREMIDDSRVVLTEHRKARAGRCNALSVRRAVTTGTCAILIARCVVVTDRR